MRSLALAALVSGLACNSTTDCCVETASAAVLEGTVVSATAQPIAGAGVQATGVRYLCDTGAEAGPAEASAVADQAGQVRLQLTSFLGSPGSYCVDLIVTAPGAAVSESVSGFEVTFYNEVPRDTSRVVIHTSF